MRTDDGVTGPPAMRADGAQHARAKDGVSDPLTVQAVDDVRWGTSSSG
jgi:hypothetical protein